MHKETHVCPKYENNTKLVSGGVKCLQERH